MSDKQQHDSWKKRKQLESEGFNIKPNRGVKLHSHNTPKHEFVKTMLCFALDELGREWDTEVTCATGRVDVYSAGPVDGAPVVYEVETGVTRKQALEKADQYAIGPIRDVIVIDPEDVPDAPAEAIDYLQTTAITGT